MNSQKTIKRIICFMGIFTVALFYFLVVYLVDVSKVASQEIVIEDSRNNSVSLTPGTEILQEINFESSIKGIKIPIVWNENEELDKNIVVKIYDSLKTEIMFEKSISESDIEEDYLILNFGNRLENYEGDLLLSIEMAKDSGANTEIKFYYSTNNDGQAYYNQRKMGGDICLTLIKDRSWITIYYMIIIGLILILCGAGYYDLKIKRKSTNVVFIHFCLILGVLYAIIIPPFTVFDDVTHYASNYQYANIILNEGEITESEKELKDEGFNKLGNVMKMRERDLPEAYVGSYDTVKPTIQSYEQIVENLFSKDDTEADTLVEYANAGLPYQSIAIWSGMVIARLLDLGQIPMIMLCRLLSLMVYIAIISYAIKIIPLGKNILTILGLLPMTLSSVVSFSYDTFYIECAYLYIALILYIAYTRFTWKKWCASIVLIALLAPHKFIYFPLAFLPIIINKNRIIKKSHKFIRLIFSKKFIVAIGIIVPLISIGIYIFFCMINPFMGREVYSEAGIGPWNNEVYTYGMLLSNVLETVRLYLDSLVYNIGYTFLHSFGWIQYYNVPLTFLIAFCVICILITIYDSEMCSVDVSVKERLIFGGISFVIISLSIGATMPWTTVNNLVVMGLHGRYFLPTYPLLYISCFKGRKKKLNTKIYNFSIIVYIIFAVISSLLLIYMFRIGITEYTQVNLRELS